MCIEDSETVLRDETYKIFFNTEAYEREADADCRTIGEVVFFER